MAAIIQRRASHDSAATMNLSERSFLGGRTSLPKVMTDFSERRLVRKISLHLEDDNESSSVCDDGSVDEVVRMIPGAKQRSAPAPLHRKELVVGRALGQGSFSRVMQVRKFNWRDDLELTQKERAARKRLQKGDYAVKHLSRTLLRKPKEFYQAAVELKREAEYMSQLNHPNLLKARAIAYGGTAALKSGRYSDFFIVSDRLVDTLDQRIDKWQRSHSPGLAIKLRYAYQLASALEYLHDKYLVFRDVKPSNCGFLANGTLQLFDFGFCRKLPDALKDREDQDVYRLSIAGTTRYMAPEMMIGQPFNCKADVYSWSLILYELLAEKKAYSDITGHAKFIRVVAELQSRPDISSLHLCAPLQGLLGGSWCPDIQKRWTMEQCLYRLVPLYEEAIQPKKRATSVVWFSTTEANRRQPLPSLAVKHSNSAPTLTIARGAGVDC